MVLLSQQLICKKLRVLKILQWAQKISRKANHLISWLFYRLFHLNPEPTTSWSFFKNWFGFITGHLIVLPICIAILEIWLQNYMSIPFNINNKVILVFDIRVSNQEITFKRFSINIFSSHSYPVSSCIMFCEKKTFVVCKRLKLLKTFD